MNLVRLIKMYLNETYSRVRICEYLSDDTPIQNRLKVGDVLSPLCFNLSLDYIIRNVEENQAVLIVYDI
jgi:hypothetical protein